VTFTAVTSLLAIEKCVSKRAQQLQQSIDNMIEKSRHIFRHMEPRVPISSKALDSLDTIRSQAVARTEIEILDNVEGSVMPSVEQDIDSSTGGLEGLDPFDWLANPSALLSRQMPGLDMSWLVGSDAWLS